jgi:hypothetical protein
MLKYKLESKSEYNDIIYYCEICGKKLKVQTSMNEYCKDGTINKHYTCSHHLVDLYNKIVK